MSRRLKRIESLKQKSNVDTLLNKAEELIGKEKGEQANTIILTVLKEEPNNDRALVLEASQALIFGFLDHALERAELAYKINPQNTMALLVIAKVYLKKGDYNKARDYYLMVNKFDDSNIDVCNDMATVALAIHQDEDALVFAQGALYIDSKNPQANIIYADINRSMAKLDVAEEYYRRAVKFDSSNVSARLGLAIVFQSIGMLEEAEEAFRLVPPNNDPDRVSWNESFVLLARGKWQLGFKKYIHGFYTKSRGPNRIRSMEEMKKPMWQGQDLKDKTILVWREQGVGDEIYFSYFVNFLIEKAKKVIFETEPRLEALFTTTFPKAEVRKQTAIAIERKQDGDVIYAETKDDFDYHIPLIQLPGILFKRVKDVPINTGFINIKDEIMDKWKERTSSIPGLKVGIMWQSGNISRGRVLEYVGVEDLKKTFKVENVSFINLMYSNIEQERKYIKDNYGVSLYEWDDLNLKDDFEDVMALIRNLDLVITAGTAVACMSGVSLVPTIMFSRFEPWTFFGQRRSIVTPETRIVKKSKWNASNTEFDDGIAELMEQYKITGKLFK